MKRVVIILSILVLSTVGAAILLPPYLNPEPHVFGGDFYTPFPTLTPFPQSTVNALSLLDYATLTPGPTSASNCTYPYYFWQNHPEVWPYQMVIGGLVYTSQEAQASFDSLPGDTRNDLVKQLYSAFLNVLKGADSRPIHRTLIDAGNWLSRNPPGSDLADAERESGMALTKSMEDYNQGVIGPGLCLDAPPSPTPNPHQSSILPVDPTLTPTSAPLPTRRVIVPITGPTSGPAPPNPAPSPTNTPALPTPTQIRPTFTPVRPTATTTPTRVMATPTNAPTSTPLPPTPTPTPTPRPTNTHSPTFTSTPTRTPTLLTNTATLVPTLPIPIDTPTPSPTNPPPPTATDTPLPPPTDTPTDIPLPTPTPILPIDTLIPTLPQ